MDTAIIVDTKPVILELEPGTYWWCACGKSANQPWCDGAHKGSDFRPVRVELEETRNVALCACRQTGSPPYCDGSHKRL